MVTDNERYATRTYQIWRRGAAVNRVDLNVSTRHESLLTIVESWRRPRVGIGHGWYRLKTTEQFDVTLFAVHRADQPVAGQTPGQLR